MKLNHILMLFLLVSLTGCIRSVATTGMPQLEEGKPTGTVYVGYIKKILPSGTRTIFLDDESIFTINIGQYTKVKVPTGKHTIRMECVTVSGWSKQDSTYNTSFTIKPDEDVYFMIQFDRKCNKPKKDDLILVTTTNDIALIRSYKFLNFEQTFSKKKIAAKKDPDAPCCDMNGTYRREERLKGEMKIVQNGSKLDILGRDLLFPTIEQLKEWVDHPEKVGPKMKIVAKIEGNIITGEWWYLHAPKNKKPFSAKVGKHAGRKDKVIYTDGEMSGVFYRNK